LIWSNSFQFFFFFFSGNNYGTVDLDLGSVYLGYQGVKICVFCQVKVSVQQKSL
jgi:hypothetical protein